jgi:hypothetical protein
VIASIIYAVAAVLIVVVYGPARLIRNPALALPVVIDPIAAPAAHHNLEG